MVSNAVIREVLPELLEAEDYPLGILKVGLRAKLPSARVRDPLNRVS